MKQSKNKYLVPGFPYCNICGVGEGGHEPDCPGNPKNNVFEGEIVSMPKKVWDMARESHERLSEMFIESNEMIIKLSEKIKKLEEKQ